MERKLVEIKVTPDSPLVITHLSSESRTIVWVSRCLDLTEKPPIVLVQGVVRRDGYLALKIEQSGKMLYPFKRARVVPGQLGVSIRLVGVDLDMLSEVCDCTIEEKERIAAYRARMAGKVQTTV